MRVRKVASDAIKLYESSQVKFKTAGTMEKSNSRQELIKAVQSRIFPKTLIWIKLRAK